MKISILLGEKHYESAKIEKEVEKEKPKYNFKCVKVKETYKKCRKCGEIKELNSFTKNSECKDGYTYTCLD
ncbi:MAG: hypothetical protein V4440_08755, partial [Pseudomonadota bacterium]